MAERIFKALVIGVLVLFIDVGLFAVGWNVLLCSVWEILPDLGFKEIVVTVAGVKLASSCMRDWYKNKE